MIKYFDHLKLVCSTVNENWTFYHNLTDELETKLSKFTNFGYCKLSVSQFFLNSIKVNFHEEFHVNLMLIDSTSF